MSWEIEYYDDKLQVWIDELPTGIRAAFNRISDLLIEFGVDLRLPHSRSLGDGLHELRPKGREGIARIFYCTVIGKRIFLLHGIIKKTDAIPRRELKIAQRRMREIKNENKN